MEYRYTLGGSLRHAARLAAVQVLYQIEQTEIAADIAIDQFKNWYLIENAELDEDAAEHHSKKHKPSVDMNFFTHLVNGVCNHSEELALKISEHLNHDWTVERLPSVLRIILKTAIYEMLYEDVPHPVVINEYIEITKDFFVESEVSFVNGLLDKVHSDITSSHSN